MAWCIWVQHMEWNTMHEHTITFYRFRARASVFVCATEETVNITHFHLIFKWKHFANGRFWFLWTRARVCACFLSSANVCSALAHLYYYFLLSNSCLPAFFVFHWHTVCEFGSVSSPDTSRSIERLGAIALISFFFLLLSLCLSVTTIDGFGYFHSFIENQWCLFVVTTNHTHLNLTDTRTTTRCEACTGTHIWQYEEKKKATGFNQKSMNIV